MERAILMCMILGAVPLSGFAQGQESAPLAGTLLITGSSTMAPLIAELATRFRTWHPVGRPYESTPAPGSRASAPVRRCYTPRSSSSLTPISGSRMSDSPMRNAATPWAARPVSVA